MTETKFLEVSNFMLQKGDFLPFVRLAYRTIGGLNAAKDMRSASAAKAGGRCFIKSATAPTRAIATAASARSCSRRCWRTASARLPQAASNLSPYQRDTITEQHVARSSSSRRTSPGSRSSPSNARADWGHVAHNLGKGGHRPVSARRDAVPVVGGESAAPLERQLDGSIGIGDSRRRR